MIYRIAESTSSNDEARDRRYGHGDIVCVERQTAGRGQRGHKWSGSEGLDLTFSLVLTPAALPASEQFDVSRVIALALVDTLGGYGIDARIKWTNDIYVGDRKITGILIENELAGTAVARMVVGIGLNVNRREFDPSLPNPTSMSLETGASYDRDEVLTRFARNAERWYGVLTDGGAAMVRTRYDSLLYRSGERHGYRFADGAVRRAAIVGTEPSGRLVMEFDDGEKGSFAFGEAEFLLKNAEL